MPQIRGIKIILILDFSVYNFIKDHMPLKKLKKKTNQQQSFTLISWSHKCVYWRKILYWEIICSSLPPNSLVFILCSEQIFYFKIIYLCNWVLLLKLLRKMPFMNQHFKRNAWDYSWVNSKCIHHSLTIVILSDLLNLWNFVSSYSCSIC